MPTFEISVPGGGRFQVTAPDEKTAIAALQQQSAQSQAAEPAPAPDKYRQAAIEERAALKPSDAGMTRRLVHGATMGADNTIMAAALTPLEMIKRGTLDPTEAYSYAKAREDLALDEARKNTGALGTAAEVLGGGVTGAGLASGGLTTARMLAPEAGLLARTASSAADAAGFGAFSGAMEGNGLAERAANAGKGAMVGAAAGGIIPPALALGGAAVAPVVSNIRARANPQAYAEGQVARAIQEGGVPPNQLSLDVIQAGNEGQGAFTLADAMGNPGQRMLSTVARAPGAGRTAVVDVLEGRQADQGRRVASALSEGFDAPQTAAQRRTTMEAARDVTADAEYGAARTNAQPVDVSNVLARLDNEIAPYGVPHDVAAPDSITAALIGIRRRLGNDTGSANDFNLVQRVRQEAADMAQQARQSGQGNRARLLGQVVREIDASLEAASTGYQQANRNFAQASRNIDAIDQGRTAALRGRPEDTIPDFQGLTPEGQAGFRSGYADPLIEQAQSAAVGANKARPLTSDAFRDEAAAIAPGNDMMQRRLGREMTMFETRNQALGGSRTADNLADAGAMGVEPQVVFGVVRNILSGNVGGAVRDVLAAGSNMLSGNTPEVRRHVAEILLQRAPNMNPQALQNMVDQTIQRIQRVQQIARQIGRGGAGALAVETAGTNRGDRIYVSPAR
jgi:hypothetical protein